MSKINSSHWLTVSSHPKDECKKDVHGSFQSSRNECTLRRRRRHREETSSSSLHNPSSFTLSRNRSCLPPEKSIHTRAQGRAYFRFRGNETERVCTMRCVATPRADWSRRFPFWIHGITGRRGSGASVGPHPVALPLPPSQQSTPTGANSEPRGAQSSTGRRSHHFPRVRIHFSVELLSRIFFCGCLESCCCCCCSFSPFGASFSINQRGREMEGEIIESFILRRIRILKAKILIIVSRIFLKFRRNFRALSCFHERE